MYTITKHFLLQKKGGNVKPIPPYKPISHAENSSDAPSSPEKDTDKGTSSRQSDPPSKQRKSSSASKSGSTSLSSSSSSSIASAQSSSNSSTSSHLSATTTSSSSGFGSSKSTSSSSSSKDKEKHNKSTSKVTNSTKGHDKELSLPTSSSKSKSSKNNSNSSSNSTSKDDIPPTTSTSHKSGQDSKSEKIISSQTNPIVQPARLNAVSPSLGSINSVIKQDSSKHTNESSGSGKETFGPKFTTSNFTETIVVNSDSVFGNETNAKPNANTTGGPNQGTTGKKRKSDGRITSGTTIDEISK